MMNGFPSDWLQRLVILCLLMSFPAKHIAEESGSWAFPRVVPRPRIVYVESLLGLSEPKHLGIEKIEI